MCMTLYRIELILEENSVFNFLGAKFVALKSSHQSNLSMNILHAGNKSHMQRGFFTSSVGNLLPVLGFLGGLYNFCNFVIIFSLI